MQEKYDRIGMHYNATRTADPYLFSRMHDLLKTKKEGLYLDIGCGTGNYTKEFDKMGYQFIGVDPSARMLEKATSETSSVTWKLGKVENLDLPNESIDGVIATLTLHHWQDLTKGFASLEKVLKPNGRIVIFTATPNQMKGYWLNHYFPKMMRDSFFQMPSLAKINMCLQRNGLKIILTENYFVKPDLQDSFLYIGKQNPKLYLDTEVRRGISSFSSLSYEDEMSEGLENLSDDIQTGKINHIIKSYENKDGDYLFLIITKEQA